MPKAKRWTPEEKLAAQRANFKRMIEDPKTRIAMSKAGRNRGKKVT